jgi:hypothetical protein
MGGSTLRKLLGYERRSQARSSTSSRGPGISSRRTLRTRWRRSLWGSSPVTRCGREEAKGSPRIARSCAVLDGAAGVFGVGGQRGRGIITAAAMVGRFAARHGRGLGRGGLLGAFPQRAESKALGALRPLPEPSRRGEDARDDRAVQTLLEGSGHPLLHALIPALAVGGGRDRATRDVSTPLARTPKGSKSSADPKQRYFKAG